MNSPCTCGHADDEHNDERASTECLIDECDCIAYEEAELEDE